MEVKKTDLPKMRDYYDKFRKRTYVMITSAQTAFVLLTLLALEATGITKLGWIGFFVVAFIGSILLNAITITLVHIIGRPFHDLVRVVVLISGEQSDVAPPNPNSYEDDKDGFQRILQTVYDLGSGSRKAGIAASGEEASIAAGNPLLVGLANTTTGIVIMNGNGEIVFHNTKAPVREGIDGQPHLDVIFEDETDTFDIWRVNIPENMRDTEKQWSRVSDKLAGEENRRIFDVAANFRRNSDAEVVLTFFDRTNLYMPEEEDLDFISFAAHELRGPITVIRGYLDVLQDELKPVLHDDQSELMLRLMVASNRLTSYINNILNAARYDRRHMKLHLVEETIQHIYDTIADDMQLRASTQGRMLVADFPKDLPTIAADPNAVSEVLGNLIDNAIKYSNQGGMIQIVARPVPGFLEVSVIDHGIGMPTNVLPNLFHKFYRSHRSRETVAGTGIGLYICKAIVSSHGGSITARSVENEGSTFSFTLPIYDTVAEKLKAGNNSNESLIEHGSGWIKNHTMYRG